MKQIDLKPAEPRQRMSRNRAGVLYGVAFLAYGLLMAGWYWLMTGISADFGMGVVVGAFVAVGVFALASRSLREVG